MDASCPRCRHLAATVRYDFGADKIVRCEACTLLYLHPWPAPEETAAVYGDDYFQNVDFLRGDNATLYGYSDYIAERANKQRQYTDLAREIKTLLPSLERAPRLLEVGCGLGYFLDEAFEEGFEVTGVEFNASAVARLGRKYAFPILEGALEDVELEEGGYDAVVMLDVIEHLRDPFAGLDKLHAALAPGGVLVVATPDAESFTSRLLGERLEDFRRTREHLFFFGRDTLESILREHGFETLAVRSIGHTFDLAFLLERLTLVNRFVFSWLHRLVKALGLGGLQLQVNPRTKMISWSRRRGAPGPALGKSLVATLPADSAVADVDRVLIDELETLGRDTRRHYRWVADVIAPWLGKSVLEVGSGIGVVSEHLLPRVEQLVLSDYQPVYLDLLRDRFGEVPGLHYRLLDLTRRPYDLDGLSVDTIVCLNVLEHLEDDDAILRALADRLPPGGRLILQVPNAPALFGSLDESYGHLRRYRPGELRTQLEEAGFEVPLLRRFNPFSIPGWILTGKILQHERIDPRSLRIYDRIVPIARALDFTSRLTGISLIACGEKR